MIISLVVFDLEGIPFAKIDIGQRVFRCLRSIRIVNGMYFIVVDVRV